MAPVTAAAAASDSLRVSVASWTGRNSRPFRNGSSAWFTLSIAASTSSVFLWPSLVYASESTRSRWSFVAASTEFSLSCAFLVLSASFCRAALKAGTAPGICACRHEREALSTFWELTTAVPMTWISSSESSAPSEALASWATFSTSSSACLMRTSSSSRMALPLTSLVPTSALFLCFATSASAVLRRPCSFAMAGARSPFASFCLAVMTFLASRQASDASFSAAVDFSSASCSASVDTFSMVLAEKTSATLTSTWALFSASAMASTRSASLAAIFRSRVSLLKAASFLPAASARSRNCVSSSVVAFAMSLDFLAASAILFLMKILAWLMAPSVLLAAASQSLMALADSSFGRTSIPFRKGISASWHFASASSAASNFSPEAITI
mmetsp:Transcript_130486/g.363605  ORF Transcript_130486/g.363605 Transcript_130486/m.363605 type:complete len:385 (-) Transcript_130486:767-1921(-)